MYTISFLAEAFMTFVTDFRAGMGDGNGIPRDSCEYRSKFKCISLMFSEKTFQTRGTGIGTETRICNCPKDWERDRTFWDAWD